MVRNMILLRKNNKSKGRNIKERKMQNTIQKMVKPSMKRKETKIGIS